MGNASYGIHLRYANPILNALRALGGSATVAEVADWVVEHLAISEEEQAETRRDGSSVFRNRLTWSKFYLDKGGYVTWSKRGVWDLTEKGENVELTDDELSNLERTVRAQLKQQKKEKGNPTEITNVDDSDIEQASDGYREELMGVLLSLTPAGFERLCQRLLRESGFQNVSVTGKSGDGGIDGHGVLQINPLVSFKVLFQCKRYQGAVSTGTVRDFRGAMQGRADKGIILTTGTFTRDARHEAVRDGAAPIELIDGEKLVDMFANLELGLTPRQDYDVDHNFFEQYMH